MRTLKIITKYTALLALIGLAGCASRPTLSETTVQSQLNAPATLKYKEKTYRQKSAKDLGSIVRYVYFEGKENGRNWKSTVELLHDRNPQQRSLQQRIELREKVYKNNGVEHFNLTEKQGELYAFVIYAPNVQQKNWQVEVARGAEVEGCGFVQYQYSQKVPLTRKVAAMTKVKLISYLKKYAVDKELQRLEQLNWQWHCEMPKLEQKINGKA